jgi:hypothetical protein
LKTKAPNTTGSNHLYNTLELLMMGIIVPETCWASNKICNNKTSVASSWHFISTYKRRCTVKITSKVGTVYDDDNDGYFYYYYYYYCYSLIPWQLDLHDLISQCPVRFIKSSRFQSQLCGTRLCRRLACSLAYEKTGIIQHNSEWCLLYQPAAN